MLLKEALNDVTIREHQLKMHLLKSPQYLHRADQEMKRQVSILYLAIAILLLFQGGFTWKAEEMGSTTLLWLTTATCFLAIINCFLLINTRSFLHRLNENWLEKEEKNAVLALRHQRREILLGTDRSSLTSQAELN